MNKIKFKELFLLVLFGILFFISSEVENVNAGANHNTWWAWQDLELSRLFL